MLFYLRRFQTNLKVRTRRVKQCQELSPVQQQQEEKETNPSTTKLNGEEAAEKKVKR
jgi:hypothetical protein